MDPHKCFKIPSMVLNWPNTIIKSFLMLLDEPTHIAKSVVGVIERAHRRLRRFYSLIGSAHMHAAENIERARVLWLDSEHCLNWSRFLIICGDRTSYFHNELVYPNVNYDRSFCTSSSSPSSTGEGGGIPHSQPVLPGIR